MKNWSSDRRKIAGSLGLPSAFLLAAVTLTTGTGCTSTMAAQHPGPELGLIQEPDPQTLSLAEKALTDGRYGDAGKLLKRVFASEPNNPQGTFLLAELNLATGKPGNASVIFSGIAQAPDARAEAYQGKGVSLMLMGKNAEGSEGLRRAVDKNPDLWRAWNALGAYHDSKGEWGEAETCYQEALNIKPRAALVLNNFGFSKILQGEFDDGIAKLNEALKLEPTLEPARRNLRLAFAWKGKYVHAMAGAEKKDMGQVLNNVGFVALLRGDYTNAESYLLRAVELDRGFNNSASRNLAYLRDMRDITNEERAGGN